MQIVLLKDVPKLGTSGEILGVKDGYARHLISSGSAAIATQGEIKNSQNKAQSEEYAEMLDKQEAEKIFGIINNKTVTVLVHAGDNGKLHGSVTPDNVSDSVLNELSVEIPKSKIRINNKENRIHTFGMHDVSVRLFAGITADIHVNVLQAN